MKKSLLLLFLGVLFMGAQVMAQMTVSGTVTDGNGEALIGVNIVESETTNGTVSDLDGNYSLLVADGASLVFSYVGFETQTVAVTSSTLDIVMTESTILEEVVVSALAIERNARQIVYANQTVNSEDLTSTTNTGVINALQGKLAGVKIQQGSGNLGASTRIVLRGETSLTGNNNALIVVDGIPIDNSAVQGGQGSATDGFVDFGNRGNDINPEDIESVTVLKGPSATSLYGSRGASGVVLITTKKGSAGKKFSVGLSTATTFEKAYIQLKRQDQFGQGYGTCDCDANDFWSGENFSWGNPVDGVVRPWTSPVLIDTDGDGEGDEYQFLSRPYSAVPNQLQDYFNTGRTTTTNVNFSGGNDRFTFYASYNNTDAEGIVPSTTYKKNSFTLNASAKFTDKLKSDFGVTIGHVNQRGTSEGNTFSSGLPNGYFYAVQTPVTVPFNELRDYNSPFHGFEGYYGSFTINPYFILNESSLTNEVTNVLAKYGLTYSPIEGLDISARIGANVIGSETEEKLPVFQYEDHLVWVDNQQTLLYEGRETGVGLYSVTNRTNVNLDLTGQATYAKEFGSSNDWSLQVTLGYNYFQRTTDRVTGSSVGGLVIPGFYTLGNSVQAPLAENANSKYRIMGVYANASIGWRQMIFLEYSARNDWSSTLPEGNRGFFYQAGGLSFIASELIPSNNALSYLKVRLSAGTTGKDAPLYALATTFIPVSTLVNLGDDSHNLTAPVNGQAVYTQSNRIGNPNLEPELALTYEVGLDVSFYKNRISAEYTYYNTANKNQIVLVSLAESSGYVDAYQNVGEISNVGHELTVSVNPMPTSVKDFKMELFWNFAKNNSEVIKISEDTDELELRAFGLFGNAGLLSLVAKEGLPYGTFKALTVQRDPDGNIIVNPLNGQPLVTDEQAVFGSYQPDFITSFGTNLGFKGLRANILFDVKKGGQFYSYTKSLAEFNGTTLTSTINNREDFVVPGSVIANPDGTYSPNTTPVTVFDYITNQPGGADLVDASYIKLRELGVSYTLPSKLFENNPLSSITIGFIAKNLKYWLADENEFADPEVNGVDGTGNAVGVESHATPSARSYGFKIDVNF